MLIEIHLNTNHKTQNTNHKTQNTKHTQNIQNAHKNTQKYFPLKKKTLSHKIIIKNTMSAMSKKKKPFSLQDFTIDFYPLHQSAQVLEIQDKCFKGFDFTYHCEQNTTIAVDSFDSPCKKDNRKLICANRHGIEQVTANCQSEWNYKSNRFKCGKQN